MTLVKFVLNAISIYSMQIFWIPQGVCNQIDALARRFIWTNSERRVMHMVSWRIVTQPKSFGGLGISRMRLVNIALLGKLVGDMMYSQHKLWVGLILSLYVPDAECFRVVSKRGSYI